MIQCEDCKKLIPGPSALCPDCCDHEFDPGEGYMCLNCGKDGLEDAMSTAHDRAKDLRKYGE